MKKTINIVDTEYITEPRAAGSGQNKTRDDRLRFTESNTHIELPFELTWSRHIGCYKPLSEKQCEAVTKSVDKGTVTNRLNRFRTAQPALFAFLCEFDQSQTRERILATLETGAAIWQAFVSKYGDVETIDDDEITRAFDEVFRITSSGECYICESGEPELLKHVTARVRNYCPEHAAHPGPYPPEGLAFHLRRVYTVQRALVTKIKSRFTGKWARAEKPVETNKERRMR